MAETSESAPPAASSTGPAQAPPQLASTPEMLESPIVCLIIGMAGSGKTTLMQRVTHHVHEKSQPSYVVNLDPAVANLPYGCNIDICDTVKYKEVMKQYNLGPNGGIMTCLNLFATRFDQVSDLLTRRASELQYAFFDTPGQIEIFTWSASGTIITDTLASTFPTVVLYVLDTARTTSPVTFMSNMLYACSILYKTQLPFILVFNKIDVCDHSFAKSWMSDFDAFQDALEAETSYSASLARSMGLVLDEFYANLTSVGVSAVTGEGMADLFAAINESKNEFVTQYRPMLLDKIARNARLAKRAESRRAAMSGTADDEDGSDDDDDDEWDNESADDDDAEQLDKLRKEMSE